MEISKEIIKALSDCAENKVRLVVTGKNGLGQEFTTEGYILPGFTNGQPNWVSEYGFGLYVGQTKTGADGQDLDLFVPLYSYSKDADYNSSTLYIQNVTEKESKKVVYTNPNFDFVINSSLAAQESKPYSVLSQEPLTDYAKELTALIGKPVIYKHGNDRVVIKSIFTSNGFVYADTTDGYFYRGLPLLQPGDIIPDKEAYETLEKYGSTPPQFGN